MTGYGRYLRLLGIDGTPTGLDGLRLLVRRQLCRVPFENVSKLLLYAREGAGRPFTLDEYLDGIEHHDLGGTCYTNNPFFASLLREAGYRADLLAADMVTPNVHTSIRVHLGDTAWHVDVGFASPFREPIALNGRPWEFVEGARRYVFDGARMTMFLGQEPAETYLSHDPPLTLESFTPIILYSYRPEAYFLNRLRIARFFDDCSIDLVDNKLFVHRAGETTEAVLHSVAEIEHAVHSLMQMPRCPVAEAIGVLASHAPACPIAALPNR
jgi:arylamine N-acetyltransferase